MFQYDSAVMSVNLQQSIKLEYKIKFIPIKYNYKGNKINNKVECYRKSVKSYKIKFYVCHPLNKIYAFVLKFRIYSFSKSKIKVCGLKKNIFNKFRKYNSKCNKNINRCDNCIYLTASKEF